MIKKFLMIAMVVSTLSTARAQFTVGFNTGLNIPTAGIALPGFVQIERDGTQKALVATLGAGVNFNGQLGYKINDNIAFNLDFGYLNGFKGGFYQHVDTNADAPGFQNNGAKIDVSFTSSFTSVSPNFTIAANSKPGKLKPYARFGLIIGGGRVTSTTTVPGLQGKDVSTYDGGTSMGFLGGIGIQKNFGEKISILLEVASKTITYYPKTLSNDETFMGAETAETVYFKKELTYDHKASEQLTFPLPYSSIGVSLGLMYQL